MFIVDVLSGCWSIFNGPPLAVGLVLVGAGLVLVGAGLVPIGASLVLVGAGLVLGNAGLTSQIALKSVRGAWGFLEFRETATHA